LSASNKQCRRHQGNRQHRAHFASRAVRRDECVARLGVRNFDGALIAVDPDADALSVSDALAERDPGP